MKLVKITHPEAGEATVAASAVPHWRSSGWSPVSETDEGAVAPAKPARTRAPKGEK